MGDVCSAEGVVDLETCFEGVVYVVGDDAGEEDGVVDGIGGGFITGEHLFRSDNGIQKKKKGVEGTHSMCGIS